MSPAGGCRPQRSCRAYFFFFAAFFFFFATHITSLP